MDEQFERHVSTPYFNPLRSPAGMLSPFAFPGTAPPAAAAPSLDDALLCIPSYLREEWRRELQAYVRCVSVVCVIVKNSRWHGRKLCVIACLP